ncbi:hypothetical protein BCR39DRAFT_588919 [Naematelia encephala]|uniref:Uncharacterized protein n=1 Tax=Naematelia encephala TaxID=71784 RepID=A0A1Y2AZL9_9TREE|nr:hypothetical protein BCR39DRAFT_588919 [Naematelia encephala]
MTFLETRDNFEFTLDKLARLDLAISCVAGITLVAALFILLSSLWVYATPAARHILDRVSFRLLCWLMAAESLYAILFIVLYGHWETAVAIGSSRACGPLMWLHWGSMMASNWFCAAMAINLCLTVVFDINPIQRGLEKWYVLIALFLGYAIPILPMARGKFGPEPNSGICYLKTPDRHAQIRELLMILVLVRIFRQSRATIGIRANGHHLDCDMSEYATRPKGFWHWFGPRVGRVYLGHLEDRFLEIALRVSVLPITMIIVISIVEGGNLYYLIHHTKLDRRQYTWFCTYQFVYGGRGLPFAVIALFTDPSLRRGIKAAWQARRKSSAARRMDVEISPSIPINLLEMLRSTTPAPTPTPALDEGKATPRSRYDKNTTPTGTGSPDTDASSILPSPLKTLHFGRSQSRESQDFVKDQSGDSQEFVKDQSRDSEAFVKVQSSPLDISEDTSVFAHQQDISEGPESHTIEITPQQDTSHTIELRQVASDIGWTDGTVIELGREEEFAIEVGQVERLEECVVPTSTPDDGDWKTKLL